jgi:enediyne polyketide synthase
MTPGIAIVGMACRYPEADSPAELWENALAGRRSFRRLPQGRLSQAGYYSPDRAVPDRTYSFEAAVLRNYHFDREKFRVPASTYRAADMAHWLALDVAADALADAGFPDAQGLPRTATGVLLGNSLTGEFSRAGLMRLRWPYVRRVVAEQLLKGGGYTVDGACSSSLLAIANACSALTAGDLDVALAGGVDLSLDPFELIGFAKVGALAADEMRVRPFGRLLARRGMRRRCAHAT